MRGLAVPGIVLAAVVISACGAKERKEDLGKQSADIANDTRLLGEAQSAVNELLRNASECDLAKPYVATATAKLDEVEKQLSTTTGRATFDSLRKQVARVAQNCP